MSRNTRDRIRSQFVYCFFFHIKFPVRFNPVSGDSDPISGKGRDFRVDDLFFLFTCFVKSLNLLKIRVKNPVQGLTIAPFATFKNRHCPIISVCITDSCKGAVA